MLAKSQPLWGPAPSQPVTKACHFREALVFLERNASNVFAYICGVVGQLFKPLLYCSSIHML